MMRRTALLFLVFVFLVQVAEAQQRGEGTIYSRFGVGQLRPAYSSKAYALGGQALAYSSGTFVNLSNPASLSDQILTRLSGGMRFEGVESTDALDVQSKLSSSAFDGLSIGLPLRPNKIGLGFGFSRISDVGYLIDVVKPLELGDEVDSGENFGARFQGNGGLTRISAGLGYRVNGHLSIGLRADGIFGIIEEIQETVFQDARFEDAHLVRSTRLHGLTAGLGARFSLQSLLREGDFFNIAAAFDLPASLTGTRLVSAGTGEATDTLGAVTTGKTDLPMSVAAGLLYQPSPKLSWNLDYRFEPWSEFSSDFSFPGYAPGGASNLSDRSRLSTGIEYFPAGRDLLASFLQRTSYRIGAFHESGYASPETAERIKSYGITSGLSLPTLSAGTRIDINLDVGSRGSAAGRLVRDRYIRIGVHFNFAERWFARRQLG